MKQSMKTFLLLMVSYLVFYLPASKAQSSADEQLAMQYYQNKEFDKALVYYEKLFGKQSNQSYYKFYVSCLIETKDFKKAEKVVKKVIKQNPAELTYCLDLGNIYNISGEPEKAKNEFQNTIKLLSASQEQIFDLARAFMALKEWDYAIDTYKKGRKLLKDTYPFNFELAEVYSEKGDLVSMINEYLNVLEMNESYIQSVQNALQTSFGNDINTDSKKNDVLKTELLKRIQRDPDKTIFSELLIWMLTQEKNFEAAFIQTKALDKRKKEEGTRVMALAKLCASNEDYEVAVKAYQYVIDKGNQNYYYVIAKTELLDVMYKKVVDQNNYTPNELIELEKSYSSALQELEKTSRTVPLMKKMAHLQAFYLDKLDEAYAVLEEAISLAREPSMLAECKLELGDILLMKGDIWEASLKYSQVEKAFKHDAIGQEAKFRNAKISFYTGDFKWAQAQLDVLKAATSKLIANDAMDLSLLISDNLALDTNTAPLLIFAKADLLSYQNKEEDAMACLDSIVKLFPNHSLSDDILYKKYQMMMKKGKYTEAAGFLESIIKIYSSDILGDDATFKLAQLYESRLNDKEKAKDLYQQLLEKYPGSLYSVEARKRFRLLRGDAVN